jgi:hypothetical protein
MKAYWHIILIVIAVVGLGGVRVAWETPTLPNLDYATAENIAKQCFRPRGDIPAATNVTLRQLKGGPKIDHAVFRANGPVTIEIADADKRKAAADRNTQTLTLPEGTELTITKAKGDFEFSLKDATAEVERTGARLLIAAVQTPVRFGPADKTPYVVKLDKVTALDFKDAQGNLKAPALPPGTEGTMEIGAGVQVTTLQPLPATPWLHETSPNLLPVRATGQKGLSEITIEARQPGLDFNASGNPVRACVFSSSSGGWQTAGIAEVKSPATGAANVRVNLPSSVLPLSEFYSTIRLALASADGQYAAYGGFAAINRVAAWLIASIFTVALFWWLLNLHHSQLVREHVADKDDWQSWRSGLFMGADNEPSLSLFQIFFWTVITIWGLAYVFVVTGSLLSLTQEMMWLLGIAGTGSVLSRLITSRPSLPAPATSPPGGVEFWQMLSTNNSFDLMKLQLFVFTLVIGIYVIWRISDTGTFPALDTNTLLLLGVSQGIYVGGKFASNTALSRAQTAREALDLKTAQLKALEGDEKRLTDEQARLKALTPSQDLIQAEKDQLAALPALRTAKQKEIDEAKAAWEKAVAELGLKPA